MYDKSWIKAILGRIPLLNYLFWVDQPAGKVAINCLDLTATPQHVAVRWSNSTNKPPIHGMFLLEATKPSILRGFRDPVPCLESVLFLRSLALLHLKGILVAEAPEGALIASCTSRRSWVLSCGPPGWYVVNSLNSISAGDNLLLEITSFRISSGMAAKSLVVALCSVLGHCLARSGTTTFKRVLSRGGAINHSWYFAKAGSASTM